MADKKELAKTYDPREVEDRTYRFWQDNGYFHAEVSDKNPYTVDKLNHPGLFNKKGHIGLCGHGEGIKYRNIRVKEL